MRMLHGRLPATALVAALTALCAGAPAAVAGSAGTARITHLSFEVVDLRPGDGISPSVVWNERFAGANAGNYDDVVDTWGGLFGESGSAGYARHGRELEASSADETRLGFYGGLVRARAAQGPFIAGVIPLMADRMRIGGYTRLVIYAHLDMQLVSDGGPDLFAMGAISTSFISPQNQTESNTFNAIYLQVGADRPSDSFSGTLAWRLDNFTPVTRRGTVKVDALLQSFGTEPGNAASIPAFPVLSSIASGPPTAPEFLPAPIPEPGSWALMLAGVGMVLWRLRSARNVTARRTLVPGY